MLAYKIETTITDDGKIILPKNLKNIYNHKVEILLLDKEIEKKKKIIHIPTFSCGGKLAEFSRDEIYEARL